MVSDRQQADYAAFNSSCAVLQLPRTIIELSGDDRAAFLHNLCTNDIKKLSPGEGCEAFLTDVKGKTIGHAIVGVEDDSITIETVEGQSELLVPHFDRYIIMDDVTLADRTNEWSSLVVAGPNAKDVIATALHVDAPAVMFARTQFEGGTIRRVPFTASETFGITTSAANIDAVINRLVESGGQTASLEAFEIARVEAFFPWFGKDFNSDNLPQEVDRDAEAISFTKGCYLGQETVARIDAIGHVNRKLVRVKLATDEAPAMGTELTVDDKNVGSTFSSVTSPDSNSAIAIALLKCDFAAAGTQLKAAGVDAIVL